MSTHSLTDRDVRVREQVEHQLDWDPEVNSRGIGVAANGGVVTLTGYIDTYAEKLAAERAVSGVRGVFNHIDIAASAVAKDVRHRIVQAMHRNADLDARRVAIDISGNVATLTGSVETWQQRDSAELAAASAPGITHVKNQILVEPPELFEEMC